MTLAYVLRTLNNYTNMKKTSDRIPEILRTNNFSCFPEPFSIPAQSINIIQLEDKKAEEFGTLTRRTRQRVQYEETSADIFREAACMLSL